MLSVILRDQALAKQLLSPHPVAWYRRGKALSKLDVKKSPGPDNTSNMFLQRYAEWTSKYLHVLFSRSLQEGQLPSDWRSARVKPLYKAGPKHLISNYHPIYLTSTCCKLLEHIIHEYISKFLVTHSVLTHCQHLVSEGILYLYPASTDSA